LPVEAIAQHATIVANLAQQMMELRALRRAVRLQVALRSRPMGSVGRAARPPMRSSVRHYPRSLDRK
jgi:hypothetical protein